jgi:hypothetical protein
MGIHFSEKMLDPPLQISFNPLQIFENIVTLSTVILPTKNIETVAIFFGNIDTLKILLGTVQ